MKLLRSTTGIKTAVAIVFIVTLSIHIIQVFWISHHGLATTRRNVYKFVKDLQISKASETTFTNPPALGNSLTQAEMPYYRWKSGNVRCSFKNGSRLNVLRDVLPVNYAEMMWPPSKSPSCGEGELLAPWSANKTKKAWMTFIVKSALHHFAYRNAVRSTWASVTMFGGKEFSVIFLIGLPDVSNQTTIWQKALREENALFGDILQCRIPDTYRNLPGKVLQSIYWIANRNIESFYTFTDDDCMMRIPNIHAFFLHLTDSDADKNIYCGFSFSSDGKRVKGERSKWFVSKEQYSYDKYPAFCHGGMYTMKLGMVQSIRCVSEVTNVTQFPLEDVLITGILREKLGYSDKNIKPVATPSGNRFEVMYYPWDGAQPHILWKMNHKWSFWNKTLHQYRQNDLIRMRGNPSEADSLAIQKLLLFWGHYT